MRLERPVSIHEVARMARGPDGRTWSYRKMLRHLTALNRELQGTLLQNMGGSGRGARWVVSLAALKRRYPDWFEDTRNLGAEIDELRDEVRELKTRQIMTAASVGRLKRKVEAA